MDKLLHVLIVEDSEDDARLVVDELKERGYNPVYSRVETPEELRAALRESRWDVVLSDYMMPRFNALEAMRLIRETGLDIPFIIITGSIGEDIAVAAMKAGAHDYMMKDNLPRLTPVIEREIHEAMRRREHQRAELALQQSEERFRQLAESIQEVFWLRDLQTNKIIYVSPSYERVWGRRRSLLYDHPDSFIESIHPEDRRRAVSALTKSPFEPYDLEYRIVHPTGSIRWVRDRAFPVRDEKGETFRISGIAEDITERKSADEELKRSRQQLRDLAARLDSIREKERASISREIHDELGQIFTSVKYEISFLRNLASRPESAGAERRPAFEEKLKSASDLVDIAIKTVQRIATELRPGILDDLGLMAALEWQAADFQHRTGIVCSLDSGLQEIRVDRDRATAVFRIFQEILTNIARHARATRVRIRIRESADHLFLNVKDNGGGITDDKISDPKSLGLLGMRERVLQLGGEIQIAGAPFKGTEVSVKIPLSPAGGEGTARRPSEKD